TPTPKLPTQVACTEPALRAAVSKGGLYTFPAGCAIALTADLPVIAKDFSLKGKGALIDGAKKYHAFSATGNASLTLDHLSIQNTVGQQGGAVAADDGPIVITDGTFTNNSAGSGGAVFSQAGLITITDSVFTGNVATDQQGHGGAVSSFSGKVT